MFRIERVGLIAAVVMIIGILSSCGSPANNEKLSELQSAKINLKKTLPCTMKLGIFFFKVILQL